MYDDDRDALAAEYVLGTLSADERDQAEALLVIDPGFAEIVRVWERRLGELNVMVEAVEPPPDVWDRIKTEVDGAEQHIAAEIEAARPANEQNAPATEASLLPTIEEATPQIAPETPAEVMPEVAGEPAAPTLDFSSTPADWLPRRRKIRTTARRLRRWLQACCRRTRTPKRKSRHRSNRLPRRRGQRSSAAPRWSIWRARRDAGAGLRWR